MSKETGEQTEMKTPGMETDEVGKAAHAYLKARDKAEKAKDDSQDAQDALVAIMRAKKRRSIVVEGVTVLLKHMDAQDIIKVKKSKQP